MIESKAIRATIVICIIIIVVCGALTAWKIISNNKQGNAADSASGLISVKVTMAAITDIGAPSLIPGNISSKDIVNIVSPATGKINKVMAKQGQNVQAGTVLFTIDTTEAMAQTNPARGQMDSAYAAQQNGKTQISQIKTSIKNADKYIAAAQKNITKVKQAISKLKSTPPTTTTGGAATTTTSQAVTLQDQLTKLQSQLADAKKTRTQLKTQLTNSVAAQKQLDKQYADSKKYYNTSLSDMANTPVAAPSAGVVTALTAKSGATISQNMSAGSISLSGNAYVECSVASDVAQNIKIDLPVTINVAGGQQVLQGKITSITADPNGGQTYIISASIENAPPTILPGTQVTVEIQGAESSTAVMIPLSAVINSDFGDTVAVVRNDGAEFRQVVIGDTDGYSVEVKEGLSAGEVVIYEGQENLTEDSKIRIVDSEE